jgi:peptide-methionine (R)-S-oxide reductase
MAFVSSPFLSTLNRGTYALPAGNFCANRLHTSLVAIAASRTRMMATLPRDPKEMTESEWKAVLEPRVHNVLRQKGTEPAGSGEYDAFYPSEGHFVCGGCSTPLYSAEAKFKSGCGWPAFDKCYKGAIDTIVDNSYGMRRVEIVCATCKGAWKASLSRRVRRRGVV